MGKRGGNRAWTRSYVGSVTIVAMLVTAAGLVMSPAQAATAVPTNLGIAGGSSVALDGGGLAFAASESAHGSSDLNGDGDTTDAVVHVRDPEGTTTNLGVASSGVLVALDGGGLAFPASESGQGPSDLNGDGDTFDTVVHVWDPTAGTTNLGIASWSFTFVALEGGGLAFHASESGHDVSDLNGDGDTFDVVVHVWDPAGGTTNLGIVGRGFGTFVALEGGGLTFVADEFAQGGGDLNGDGDGDDQVMHVWDPAVGITNLGIDLFNQGSAVSGAGVALDGGGLAFLASESGRGNRDLNGDSDTFDTVVHVWDPTAGTTNLGIASVTVDAVALDGGGLAFVASESGQGGSDLNGDSDTGDQVMHVWDPTAGTTNLGIASVTVDAVALDGGGLAFPASESGQGASDLNGDGDTFDTVVHVWDPAGGTTNLGIASSSFVALEGGGLAFSASESGQGGSDLNGDSDTGDQVMHVWDPTAGTTNLGIAGDGVVALDGGLAFWAFEFQGGSDLNGDGDTFDLVLHVWSPAGGTTNLGTVGGGVVALDGGGLAFSASEAGQGASDLNGDGDTTDFVVQVWDPSPEVCDGIDNDLDGTVDDGVTSTFHADADSDGYGDPNVTTEACSAPTGYLVDSTDADDTDPTIYPGAPELCDGKDNDQDGTVDEGWPDTDGDTIADCVDPDDDGDGIPDGEDPDVVVVAVANLPATSISNGNRNAFLTRLNYVETLVANGDAGTAIDELGALRKRIDGCNGTGRERPDKNDWILDCGGQRVIRDLVNQLIANLEATLPE